MNRKSTAASPSAPHVVAGRWRLERKLGEGATGAAFLARHVVSGLRATVKVVSAQLGEEGLERLRSEQRALAQLSSEHIPRQLDLGADQTSFYLAYEHIEGSSLEQLGALGVNDALAVAYGVASALAEAHLRGILHRDVKPANVIVPRADNGQLAFARAMLVDFGVAGILERRGGTQQTRPGQIYGSPLYMSPEQLSGSPQTAAADIYGLGALLYTMIFGEPPFPEQSLMELIRAVMESPLTFPDAPPLSAGLRDFLERSLAKDPRQRPVDGGAARAELSRLITAEADPLISMVAPRPEGLTFPPPPGRAAAAAPPAGHDAVAARPKRAPVGSPASRLSPWTISALVLSALLTVAFFVSLASERVLSLLLPVAGLVLSWLLAFSVHHSIEARRPSLGTTVTTLLGRAHVVEGLSQSLAVDVERLIDACRELDQRILAKTLSLMLGEYRNASESSDRQAALMKMVELMEKLQSKLAPWYVRRQALLSWGIGLLGTLLSGAKVVSEIVALFWK